MRAESSIDGASVPWKFPIVLLPKFKYLLIAIILPLLFSLPLQLCAQVLPGAARTELYFPLLKGDKIALLSNHSGMVGDRHTLDIMLEGGLDVVRIYSPEHGFRGTADAGEMVAGGRDARSGLPIVSLYSKSSKIDLTGIDAVVVDIQDVGCRFYTYYITMLRLMRSALPLGVKFVILDRPNPNGMYVDGPVLDMKYKSGVGALPIPVVHGMTLGELAGMADGMKWIAPGSESFGERLIVVPCKGYTHSTRYVLPLPPSPNLPNMKSIYLYPSLCFFEATPVSVGRGTTVPFQVYGHPSFKSGFSFVPQSGKGAKSPLQQGRRCYGRDLRCLSDEQIIAAGINLEYIVDAYREYKEKDKFFTSFFELLIGNDKVRRMIEEGKSAAQIKESWAEDVENFKKQRKAYLIYPE